MQRKVDVCTATELMAFCLGDCGQVIQEVDSHLPHLLTVLPFWSASGIVFFFLKWHISSIFESVQIGHLLSFGMSDTDPEVIFHLCVSFLVKQWLSLSTSAEGYSEKQLLLVILLQSKNIWVAQGLCPG